MAPSNVDQYLGKMVLIAITDRDHTGKWLRQRQLHGRIAEISDERGIVVSVESLPTPFTMPPQLDCLQTAPPGEYRERSSGKVIQDPDYICFWEITWSESSDGGVERWQQGPKMEVPTSVGRF